LANPDESWRKHPSLVQMHRELRASNDATAKKIASERKKREAAERQEERREDRELRKKHKRRFLYR